MASWSSFDWNNRLILIYLSDMIIQDGPDPSQMILFPIIVDFPMLCSYGIAGTLGWILSSRIKPFNGMDFRYSRTQRSRDIKLYLILWFIWSCIWWCWFLKISQRQGIPTFLSTNVQRYQTPFNFLIYLMYLMFHFMILVLFTLLGIWRFWFLKRYFINSMDFCTQSWVKIKLSPLFWYLLLRRHTCK